MSDDTFTTDHPQTVALLTRTLAAVADSTPSRDRSEELLADLDAGALGAGTASAVRRQEPGVDGSDPEVVDAVVVPLDAPHRRHRLLALVAAVVLLLAATAVALTRLGDDADTGVVTSPGDVDTGWILPPEGWEVTSVDTDYLDIEGFGPCPCTQWAAARPGGDPAFVSVTESGPLDESAGLDLMTGAEAVDVGGRTGTTASAGSLGAPDVFVLTVESADRALALHSAGIDVDGLVLLADSWLDQVDAGDEADPGRLALPDDVTGIATSTRDGSFEHMVLVRARHAESGAEVEYRMVPTGYDRGTLVLADSLEVVDGRIRGTWFVPGGAGGEDLRATAVVDDRLDVVVGDSFSRAPLPPLSAEELDAFVDGLREVTTAEWRDAIAGADVSDAEVREAVSLFEPPLTG